MDNTPEQLRRRSDLLRLTRECFYAAGFLEADTPVRIPAPAPEEYIEAVQADGQFLRTSPELAHKELLSRGAEKIFELGSAFRSGEIGRKHREEFAILEYYAVHWDYRKLAEFTARLLAEVAEKFTGSSIIPFSGSFYDLKQLEYITVDEAYRKYAGVSAFDSDRAGDFDELMVTKVEPHLGEKGITFLLDYPVSRASLARRSVANPSVAERWEVYVAGMELGNAFGELTDAAEQRSRFAASRRFRSSQGMHEYPEPEEFYAALERGIPEASGCAIGFDRVAMLMMNVGDIGEVRFHPHL